MEKALAAAETNTPAKATQRAEEKEYPVVRTKPKECVVPDAWEFLLPDHYGPTILPCNCQSNGRAPPLPHQLEYKALDRNTQRYTVNRRVSQSRRTSDVHSG